MKSFDFYELFLEDAKLMTKDEADEYLADVVKYGINGEEPIYFMHNIVKLAFKYAKKIIDNDQGKAEQ